MFTILENNEPQREKKVEKTKTKKIMQKGKKLAKPTRTYHKTAKKYHQRVTNHFPTTTKEERMKE